MKFIPAGLLLLASLFPLTASAIDAVMEIQFETQGTIIGPNTTPGQEGTIELSGLSGGLRLGGADRCRPITVQKRIDATTPLLFNALDNGEIATLVTIRGFEMGDHHYIFALENASIASISLSGTASELVSTEQLSFTYQKITWTAVSNGATGEVICQPNSTP